MAIYYVWSGAAGSANGSSWANAFLLLATAMSSKTGADTICVAHDHDETTAAQLNLFCAGTPIAPLKVVCVNRAGSVPPVTADKRTTGLIKTSGDNEIRTGIGSVHFDGLIFIAGNSTGAANWRLQTTPGQFARFDNCSLRIGSTGAGEIQGIDVGSWSEWNNTTVSFAGVTQSIRLSHQGLRWRNTPNALLGVIPTTLFVRPTNIAGYVELIGVDLSAAGAGKTICGTNGGSPTQFRFIDCKLNAAVTKYAVPTQLCQIEADFVRSSPSGNYALSRHRWSGEMTEEATIVRTGGASDGTTPIAWKVITTANCGFSQPFECPPIAVWNDATGAPKTATLEGIWGGGAVPNDEDVWLDVEYLGDGASPQGSFVNDGKPDLLTATAPQATSTEAWGGSTTKFKLAVTFTPQQKGWVYARIKCGKASSTFYLDPKVTLS